MAAPMQRLGDAIKRKRRKGTTVEMYLVYRQPKAKSVTQAVAPGVRALTWQEFVNEFPPNEN
jgi:hypothetical protein